MSAMCEAHRLSAAFVTTLGSIVALVALGGSQTHTLGSLLQRKGTQCANQIEFGRLSLQTQGSQGTAYPTEELQSSNIPVRKNPVPRVTPKLRSALVEAKHIYLPGVHQFTKTDNSRKQVASTWVPRGACVPIGRLDMGGFRYNAWMGPSWHLCANARVDQSGNMCCPLTKTDSS